MNWLLPIRPGQTFLDVSTIFHLAWWTFMGSNFWYLRIPLSAALALGLVGSYAWEVFERFAEPRWPQFWQHPESLLNAYISDPLTSVVGILFAYYVLRHWG